MEDLLLRFNNREERDNFATWLTNFFVEDEWNSVDKTPPVVSLNTDWENNIINVEYE